MFEHMLEKIKAALTEGDIEKALRIVESWEIFNPFGVCESNEIEQVFEEFGII